MSSPTWQWGRGGLAVSWAIMQGARVDLARRLEEQHQAPQQPTASQQEILQPAAACLDRAIKGRAGLAHRNAGEGAADGGSALVLPHIDALHHR